MQTKQFPSVREDSAEDFLKWQPEFHTGHDQVDQQHKKRVRFYTTRPWGDVTEFIPSRYKLPIDLQKTNGSPPISYIFSFICFEPLVL